MNPFYRQTMARRRKASIRAELPEPSGAGVVTLRLYDAIDSWGGDWGVSAKEFAKALDALDADTSEIRLLINSPGGEVWEGLAILNALRAHPAHVVAVVEGIAASSASFIAAGVDECVMMPNSEMFIHNAWGLCVGNSADMERMARDLSGEDRNIAAIYAAKSGGTVDEWLTQMADEPFLVGVQAVDAGLADRVEGPATDAAVRAKAHFDLSPLSRHTAAPAAALGERVPATDPPATTEPGNPTERTDAMSDTLMAGLRDRLGIAPEANDDAILAHVDKLVEQATAPTPQASIPEGMTLVEADRLEAMQAAGAELAAIRAERDTERREGLVEAAVNSGRISAARRGHWLAQLNADEEGMAPILAALPPVIPLAEIGHSDGIESADDALYAKVSAAITTKKES